MAKSIAALAAALVPLGLIQEHFLGADPYQAFPSDAGVTNQHVAKLHQNKGIMQPTFATSAY
jgi:hypothetical protein